MPDYLAILSAHIDQLKNDIINGNLEDFRTGLMSLDPTVIPYVVACLMIDLGESHENQLFGQFKVLTLLF